MAKNTKRDKDTVLDELVEAKKKYHALSKEYNILERKSKEKEISENVGKCFKCVHDKDDRYNEYIKITHTREEDLVYKGISITLYNYSEDEGGDGCRIEFNESLYSFDSDHREYEPISDEEWKEVVIKTEEYFKKLGE